MAIIYFAIIFAESLNEMLQSNTSTSRGKYSSGKGDLRLMRQEQTSLTKDLTKLVVVPGRRHLIHMASRRLFGPTDWCFAQQLNHLIRSEMIIHYNNLTDRTFLCFPIFYQQGTVSSLSTPSVTFPLPNQFSRPSIVPDSKFYTLQYQ